MIRDRSSEFRRKVVANAEDVLSDRKVNGTPEPILPSNLFFVEVDEVRKLIINLANDVAELEVEQSNILAKTMIEESQKADLEKDKKNIKYCHAEDIDLRMRKHHIEVLVKKLYDVLENFAAAQEDYRKRATKRIKRQLELAGEQLTDTEINELFDSNITQIYNRDLTTVAMRSVMDDASSRQKEILKLEESISELNDLYNDMAILLQQQGELVENIDRNVEEATYYLHEGNQQARIAISYKKGAIRKKIFIIIVITVILVIIIIALLIYFLIRKN
ncbi:unnamed protein product [Dracunculus medinensis]|uniref:t-SNARE coiled-coil homology domain-containing protein n=1 Tax=Dracunculus medinensis TaxID=318479 RepID=A0A0N4UCM3_DRAME|nr:unnamed protein product [Dracunculus medinensis]